MSLSQLLEERECVDRCRSVQHGELVCAALTKREVLDSELCGYLQYICCSCESVKDGMGRTALLVAASCGRADVVKWLLRARHANVNSRDNESGYTPLHRSIFYGKIHVAVPLIKMGANIGLMDFNGLTSLEHAMEDCQRLTGPYNENYGEVYVWGSNTNYTLGPQQARMVPDLLDAYHREHPNLPVQQVCLAKFHCVLVSTDGQVFSCGHGQGGRLGLGTEKTVLAPEQVKFSAGHHACPVVCKMASIAIDHSVFLTESGQVWTCGLNANRVLGIQPPPAQVLAPQHISHLQHPIEGIFAARFHSVAWGPKAIYTWGLHAGQLGHDKSSQKYIITPKLVTCLFGFDSEIKTAAASNGATAIVTTKGDIYVLHEYMCRRIVCRQLSITSINVVGGKLNEKIDNSISSEENHELRMVGLNKVGNLFIWEESDQQFSRCIFNINRSLRIRQFALNLTEILFVTHCGEAFQGVLKTRKRKPMEYGVHIKKSAFHDFLDKNICQMVKLNKIPRVHRAVAIYSDLKGRNYAVLQASPNRNLTRVPEVSSSLIKDDMHLLLEDSSEDDSVHDAIFKVGSRFFPVHHYVVAYQSSKLSDLIAASTDDIIEILNVQADIFQQMLIFIYSGSCDLLKTGVCPEKFQLLCKKVKKSEDLAQVDKTHQPTNVSACQYYSEQKFKQKQVSVDENGKDPVRMLQEAAKRFGVKLLQKYLENVYYESGCIRMKKEKHICTWSKFDRKEHPKLKDVILKTKDGREIAVHKCILAARLEYFNNLFSLRWNTNSPTREISLPYSSSVINHLIDFLYTDELPSLESKDIDHVCSLLILADQLFVSRLKETCECTLSTFVTLKNVVQMLSFSSMYNAEQLKTFCMEFICTNLAAVLEMRLLEMVDEQLLQDLTDFYSEYNPVMQQRVITPYSYAPTDEIVNAAGSAFQVVLDNSDNEVDVKSTPKLQKRRPRPRRSTSDSNRKSLSFSDAIESPSEFIESSIDEVSINETDPIVEQAVDSQESHSNKVQARLKAIAFAQSKVDCDNILTNYTKLPFKSAITEVSLTDFPELESHHSNSHSKLLRKPEKTELKHKITKLSQKQRKRLSSESSSHTLEPCSPVLSESPKNPWKICAEISNVTPIGSPDNSASINSIISDEIKQKENLVKMKTKLLIHTQMEDKAIEDLYKFYNVDNVFDETIAINRVQIGSVASPVWINSNKMK